MKRRSLRSVLGFVLVLTSVGAANLWAQPVITSQTTNQLNQAIGTNLLLKVTAQASAPMVYQWRLNGVNIPNATNDIFSITNLRATNCGNYSLAVSDGNFTVDSAVIRVTPAVQAILTNDNFSARGILTPAFGGTVRSDNRTATMEKNEAKHAYKTGGASIWFKWTPSIKGIVTFSTAGSGFDTILAAYTGAKVDGLKVVPSSVSDDDGGGYLTSKLSFNADAGKEYEICVDGLNGVTGDVVLNWSEDFTSDLLPTIKKMPKTVNTVSKHGKVNLNFDCDPSKDGWLFNGQPLSDHLTNYTVADVDDMHVGKYVAQAASSGGHKNSTLPANIQINTRQDGSTDANAIALDKFSDVGTSGPPAPPPPPGGKGTLSLQGGGDTRCFTVSQIFSTVGAQKEPGEPNHCGQIGGASMWFAYTAPVDGELHINTEGSSFNTILAVYVGPGDSFATLTNVGCGFTTNKDTLGQPHVFVQNVKAGTTYYIVVDGTGGATGVAHLNVNSGAPVVLISAPRDTVANPGTNILFSVSATGSTPVLYQWLYNGSIIGGATNATLTVTNLQSSKTGAYSVVVSNSVSSSRVTAQLGLLPPPLPVFSQMTRSGSSIQFQLSGLSGHGCIVQASTNLIQWTSISTNLAGTNLVSVTETNTGKFKCRFYRVVAQ